MGWFEGNLYISIGKHPQFYCMQIFITAFKEWVGRIIELFVYSYWFSYKPEWICILIW